MRYDVIVRLVLAVLFAGALVEFAQSSREVRLSVRIVDAATGQPTPVRVRLRNLEVAEGYLKEVEQDLANPGNNLDRQAVRHRAQLERQIAEARTKLKAMAGR